MKNSVALGFLWSFIERFASKGVQFVIGIILARLLLPYDYGLVAMISVFLVIAEVFIEGGFSNALIRSTHPSDSDYSTVFYFNLGISVIIYIFLFFFSEAIGRFYSELKLIALVRIISLNLIINSLSIVQRTMLTIAMDFKKQTIISLVAVVVSGIVGILAAVSGYGYWALVIQSILNSLINTIILWLTTKWHPLLAFSFHSFRSMFSFGYKLLLSSILHNLYNKLYVVVIGKRFSSSDVGYYNNAYTLSSFLSINLTDTMVRVMYPALCRLNGNDHEFKKTFADYLRLSAYLIFPLMIGMAVLSEPLVIVLLTNKWIYLVPLLQILCVSFMFYPMTVINNQVLNAKGKSDFFLKAEIIKKVLGIVILVITVSFGLRAICVGLLIYSILDFIIIVFFTNRLIGTSFLYQIRLNLPIVLISSTMGAVVYASQTIIDNNLLKLLLGFSFGFFYYLFSSFLFRLPELRHILTFFGWNYYGK